MDKNKRTESAIFSELSTLCSCPGYLHAIAFFCFRGNTISYDDVITTEDVLEQFGMDRLVRTEISTLIGLACKGDLNTEIQSPEIIQAYIDKTEALLEEIHQSMIPDMREIFECEQMSNPDFNPFKKGAVLREAIFYGGESAHHFQYRDLSSLKYIKDSEWLTYNKGFSSEEAISTIKAIQELQNRKINEFIPSLNITNPNNWTALNVYKFTAEEVSEESSIDLCVVTSVIESFVSPTPIGMNDFSSLDDFNPKNAYPIIKLNDSDYLLFQNYSLAEALYETPFFWFNEDKAYRSTAMKNRGDFTESFSAQRLIRVFGDKNVFLNIVILDSKRNTVGEIDVLVVYANRAIILQAKSKKLTIASRKGNDLSLKADFKKAAQEAYDQAYSCANLILNPNYKLFDDKGNELNIERNLSEIYPFCVVSDHYPALALQARNFLNFSKTNVIKPPFVMDVFFLDVATEILETPLYFLSYINRRTDYNDKILSTHELTILSYHLKQNLWIDDKYTMIQLGDDIGADLDLAMLVRRCGVPGEKTPEGILTKFKDTTFGRLIKQIEEQEEAGVIDLGLMLLHLSEDTVNQLNNRIDHIAKLALSDHKNHDLTIGLKIGSVGLTVHCNSDPISIAEPNLKRHAGIRKYSQKAKEWFAICIDPETKRLKFSQKLSCEWEQSDEFDKILANTPNPQRKINIGTVVKGRKIGRNEKCPCGSGVKYKNCCLK
ncbi:SEC-C metal-binding domain-containing protein [Xenorhabdus cabanillasii]|uniref:SecA-related protein n=1 Tax=Xenorhabdus cabanillasii JM26 TaxID=1427517 RepID=W1JC79_9GAMM|nr:SEC-C metal-binding domain-containing protein [Xenorhabdus cabanillasii]PHM76614.1 prepilin peptidase [Xenorhabdus cabanillasii JM26]CDL87260.1 SecA-related protein [Xenorhabdus cabanillasii JM26]